MGFDVSVIIPIFKVEAFIERCAVNLLEQTLTDVELIFVDDCSPDASIDILHAVLLRYPEKKDHVKVIRHERNLGLPSARNSGLAVATGEYIFHCDSDDWLEKNGLELLYNHAVSNNADIVWCDWFLSFSGNERYMSQKPTSTNINRLEVIKAILAGALKYNVWNKLVRRSIYIENKITFPDGFGMGEDMTMIKLFVFANRISYLDQAVYHYVQLNQEAFTKKTTEVHLDQIKHNADDTISYLESRMKDIPSQYFHFFKLNVKLPFLISADTRSYERWLLWFPESNQYIDKNPLFNLRTKIIQKAAIKRQFWIVKIYYHLVMRFVYGIIYN